MGLLVVALVGTGIWGYNQYMQNQDYSIRTDNLYQRSFYELVGQVNNIEAGLSKMMVSGDQGQSIMMLSNVWRQADSAGSNLGQLPLSHMALEKTSKFLSQLGDYCHYLTLKAGQGKPITLEEMDNLKQLYGSSINLSNELRILESGVNEGTVSWEEIRNKGNKQLKEASQDLVTQQFTKIEDTSIEYPTLIYDGPFSDTLLKPKKLNDLGDDIDYKKAETIALDFVGRDRAASVGKGPETQGDIETWGVYIETKDGEGPLYLSITKKGGKVVSLISEGSVNEPKLSLKEGQNRGEAFLKKKGFKGMVPTYGESHQGIGVFNFAFKDGDVVVYTDLIKVKVSLDTGDIIGFEAMNYLLAHKDRNIREPELSLEDASNLVNMNLDISSKGLAIIPGKSGNEILCYEFKGKFGEDSFIVYINANTGNEEDILKLINTDNGTLVI
ncbi:MAG TPA: germination protein YpeB [Clostridia bacterium]|nr:germination protein YpeB [Clostridia bacterium]